MIDLKKITLKPLERISPSQFTRLKKCPYNSILSKTFAYPLLPYSPSIHLGTIIHKCVCKIFIGEVSTEEEFDQTWNAFEKEEERKLTDYGFDFFIPLEENISGYTIKKLQVRSIFRKKLLKSEKENSGGHDIQFMNEKWLQSKDAKIAGSVDHILKIDSFVKLSDTKTGSILTEEGEIKESYQDQLKLYAYLYAEEYGKYPQELAISDLNQNEYSIPFTEEECEALAQTAKDELENINILVYKNDLEKLARPAFEKCTKCLYRPACDYHWDIQTDVPSNMFTDVNGFLISINEYNNGNININLDKDGSKLTITKLEKYSLGYLHSLKGEKVGIYNVYKSDSEGIYKATKLTTIYAA